MLQFTTWKTHHIACWGMAPEHDCTLSVNSGTAWRHGLRLDIRSSYDCASLTAVLLAIVVTDMKATAFVTAAITAVRLAPAGERVARVVGVAVIGTGLLLIARSELG